MPELARVIAIATLSLAAGQARGATGPVYVDFEAGPVFTTRNDVRVPGDGGTTLSLVDDLSTPAAPVFRARLSLRLGERHLVSALYAPLRLNATGTIDRDVRFAGVTYAAGRSLLAVYRFDSYRLTYRYSFVLRPGLELAAGLTAKIRDAEISLHGARTSSKKNTGFVPLVSVHLAWRPGAGSVGLLLDADALAAPQGRAEDVLLALTWLAREGVTLRAGYRTLEGGADNDEVYTFAWLSYVVVGAELRF